MRGQPFCRYVYIGLGSNLANRMRNIRMAVALLKRSRGIRFVRISSIYETDPWGNTRQGRFLNAVARVGTGLSPRGLLHLLQRIEKRLGRKRRFKWSPRTIDLDILLFGRLRCTGTDLTIPHKYITERMFVMVPLAELDNSIRLNGRYLKCWIEGLSGEPSLEVKVRFGHKQKTP